MTRRPEVGGKRKGAGRPPRSPAERGVGRPALGDAKRGRRVQILVTAEVDDEITAAAERAGLSRSDWGAAALKRAIADTATSP